MQLRLITTPSLRRRRLLSGGRSVYVAGSIRVRRRIGLLTVFRFYIVEFFVSVICSVLFSIYLAKMYRSRLEEPKLLPQYRKKHSWAKALNLELKWRQKQAEAKYNQHKAHDETEVARHRAVKKDIPYLHIANKTFELATQMDWARGFAITEKPKQVFIYTFRQDDQTFQNYFELFATATSENWEGIAHLKRDNENIYRGKYVCDNVPRDLLCFFLEGLREKVEDCLKQPRNNEDFLNNLVIFRGLLPALRQLAAVNLVHGTLNQKCYFIDRFKKPKLVHPGLMLSPGDEYSADPVQTRYLSYALHQKDNISLRDDMESYFYYFYDYMSLAGLPWSTNDCLRTVELMKAAVLTQNALLEDTLKGTPRSVSNAVVELRNIVVNDGADILDRYDQMDVVLSICYEELSKEIKNEAAKEEEELSEQI